MFPEGGGFVNRTDPVRGSAATGMNPEGGTTKKSHRPPPPPPHRLINGTAHVKMVDQIVVSAAGFP